MAQGEFVDLNLLQTSCMLHDIARVCDFRELERDKFVEEVTDEKWQKWVKLREQYKGTHHADIAFKQMGERGFTETAEVIRLHKSTAILDEPEAFDSLEKKIMYYADKRVKHTEIVDIKERFRDGRERYGKYDDTVATERFEEVEKRTFALEVELFESLDIRPGDIR